MAGGREEPYDARWEDTEAEREEVIDAVVDGDRSISPGTAQAALRHRDFRIVWGGTFASNVGTWMQNVLLGAYALQLTGDPGYVGVLFFAQLGPLLFLGTIGGVLATWSIAAVSSSGCSSSSSCSPSSSRSSRCPASRQRSRSSSACSRSASATPSAHRHWARSCRSSCRTRTSRVPSHSSRHR